MNDLAYTRPKEKSDSPAMPMGGSSSEPSKPEYPSLRFNGVQAETAGLTQCKIGEEYEITIRIKARRLGGESYENGPEGKPGAEFDVIAADEPQEIESSEDEPDDETDEKPVVRPKAKILTPRGMGMVKPSDEEEED